MSGVTASELPEWCARLPAINAGLNSLATVLLAAGWYAIRSDRKRSHQFLMLAAFTTSILFLGCYVTYHAGLHFYTGSHGKPFAGDGWVRLFYFVMLISHVVLAATVPFLAVAAIYHGMRKSRDVHRRIGRIALPIWLYVSITGVGIYYMLYSG